jgi:hypothetical protein
MGYPDTFEDCEQLSWCCDNCVINRGLPLESLETAGFSPSIDVRAQKTKAKRKARKAGDIYPAAVQEWAPRIKQEILVWRAECRKRLLEEDKIHPYLPEVAILPTTVVNAIIKQLRHTKTLNGMANILSSAKFRYPLSFVGMEDIVRLWVKINCTIEDLLSAQGPLLFECLI